MIYGLSSSILQNYALYVGSAKSFSTEDMFKNLSEELGCDGETITKDGLASFIKENGNKLSVTKLKALETLQSSWSTISGGEDSISFGNMKGYTSLLGLIYTSDRVTPVSSSLAANSSNAKSKINDILISSVIGGGSKATESALNNYLKELLADDSDEYDNGDDIDAVMNMLSKMTSLRSNAIDSSLVQLSADYRV